MANFNKVILAGNLTRDPQLSYLPSNTPVCEFGLAINRKWKDQNGEMREDTCFVDLQAQRVAPVECAAGQPRMRKSEIWRKLAGAPKLRLSLKRRFGRALIEQGHSTQIVVITDQTIG